MLFNKMGLDSSILKAVKDLGFEGATPIQEKVIPQILEENNDLLALAQTGTGKTIAFLVATFHHLLTNPSDSNSSNPRAIIMAPTRELAVQVVEEAKALISKVIFARFAFPDLL